MKHVDMLREEWAKHCTANYKKYRDKIQALNKRIRELQVEVDICIRNHEYTDVELKREEIEIVQKQLKEHAPINFEEYVKREFAKDFKTIVGDTILTDQDRLFFRIYFLREYLGFKVNGAIKKLGVDNRAYYKAYHAGMENFFPGDDPEELSEVG